MVGMKDTAGRPGPGEAQSHRRPGMLGGGQGGRSGHAVPWTVPQRVTRPRGKAWTEVTFRLENNLRASHGDPELERLRGSGQGERELQGVAPGGRAPWKLHPPPTAPAGLPQPLCQAGVGRVHGEGQPPAGPSRGTRARTGGAGQTRYIPREADCRHHPFNQTSAQLADSDSREDPAGPRVPTPDPSWRVYRLRTAGQPRFQPDGLCRRRAALPS